jgi:hypothetical protein
MRVDKYFDLYKKARYFTHEGVKVFYKQAILQVSELGRTKVFRLKEESEAKYKYLRLKGNRY